MRRRPSRRPLAAEPLDDRTAPATLTVNTLADDTTADAVLTLREAMTLVNAGTTADPGNGLGRPLTAAEAAQLAGALGTADAVAFETAPGTPLAGTIAVQNKSLPALTAPADVRGPGAAVLTVSGGQTFGVFDLGPAYRGTVGGLTVADGKIPGTAPFSLFGVRNRGNLTLDAVAVVSATGFESGVENTAAGTLTVRGSSFSGLSSGVETAGTAVVENCTFSGLLFQGILNTGMVTVAGCALAGNQTGSGFQNAGTAVVRNTTVTGSRFAGFQNTGTLTLVGCTASGNQGPGIDNAGTAQLLVQTGTLMGNAAEGVRNVGTATVEASTVAGNAADGVLNTFDFETKVVGTLTLRDSTVSKNAGAGINNDAVPLQKIGDPRILGRLTVVGSTVAGNGGKSGFGGIDNEGSADIEGSTVSGNAGIGLRNNFDSKATVRNSTVTGNLRTSFDGTGTGGILAVVGLPGFFADAEVLLQNTLAAGNILRRVDTAKGTMVDIPHDVRGPFVAAGRFNLIGAGFATSGLQDGVNGNRVGTGAAPIDAKLGVLADNGGPTRTHALLAGSPALDAGDPAFVPPPATDQRGLPRVSNARLDIGAFEFQVAPNTPPTISDIPDKAVVAGDSTGALGFTIGDAETPAGLLMLSVVSSNPGLVPPSAVVFGGAGANRTVTVATTPGMAGVSILTVTVTDAGGLSASDPFTLTITVPPGNTPPTISDIPDRTVVAGDSTGAIPFTVADAETPAGMLVLSVVSSNPGLVPPSAVVFGGAGANRTVTVATAPGMAGVSMLTVTVTDAGGLTASDPFTVTITVPPPPPGNTPPTISDLPDRAVVAGDSTGAIGFTVSDAETPAGLLTLTVVSSNPGLVPPSAVMFGGAGANRTVMVATTPGMAGVSVLTVTVTDGGGLTASDPFTLTITVPPPPPPPPGSPPPPPAGNTPPTISDLPDLTVPAGQTVGPLPFVVADLETPAASLSLAASSGDDGVLPGGLFVLGGSGANRTLTLTPAPGRTGTVVVTVVVGDAGGLTDTETFAITFTSPPPPPTGGGTSGGGGTGGSGTGGGAGGGGGGTGGGGGASSPATSLTGPQIAVGALRPNDPDVRVFDANGVFLFELNVFEPGVTSTNVALADFTRDGVNDVIVGAGNGSARVVIFDGVTRAVLVDGMSRGTAAESFRGATVAAGDLTGDGVPDLIVGSVIRNVSGLGFVVQDAKVEVFDGSQILGPPALFGELAGRIAEFVPYVSFGGGVVAAVGDVNGDGRADLITAPARDGGPHVRVFDGTTVLTPGRTVLVPDFMAYLPTCTIGMYVAAGDLDGDGTAEVVTGTRVGGGPHVRAFGFTGGVFAAVAETMLGDAADRSGVTVAARDLDGDEKAEILAGRGVGKEPQVLVLDGRDIAGRVGPVVDPPGVTIGAVDGNWASSFRQVVVAEGTFDRTVPSKRVSLFRINPEVIPPGTSLLDLNRFGVAVSVPPEAILLQAEATFVVDTGSDGVISPLGGPPFFGTLAEAPVSVAERGIGASRSLRFFIPDSPEFELRRTWNYTVRFTACYAGPGGVTIVQGTIPLTANDAVSVFTPGPASGLVTSQTVAQIVDGKQLAERARFAGFDEPYRGGVFVG